MCDNGVCTALERGLYSYKITTLTIDVDFLYHNRVDDLVENNLIAFRHVDRSAVRLRVLSSLIHVDPRKIFF